MTRKVSRTDVNLLVDAILLLLFIALCTCSVILEFVFPARSQAGEWLLWSISFDAWSRLRFAILASLAVAVLLHLMLHWSWVCGAMSMRLQGKANRKNIAPDDPNRTLWGVGLLIFIINLMGAIIAAAALMIQPPTVSP